MAVQVASTLKINVCSILVGEAKGKRMFGKHKYEVEDKWKWILQKYDQGRGMFIRGRTRTRISVVKNFFKISVLSNARNLLTIRATSSSYTQLCSME